MLFLLWLQVDVIFTLGEIIEDGENLIGLAYIFLPYYIGLYFSPVTILVLIYNIFTIRRK